MENAVSQLQRVGLKLFVDDSSSFALRELVPIYHRWIQQHVVEGVLIDVADYQHVPGGPGVMLVAHEGNYAMDLEDRRGLLYYRKQPVDGSLTERLVSLARTVLVAARQLEQEPSLAGRIRFPGNELQIVANDRLLAPNSEETFAAIAPSMNELLARLYDGVECEVRRESDPRERFSVMIRAPQPVAVAELLTRLER